MKKLSKALAVKDLKKGAYTRAPGDGILDIERKELTSLEGCPSKLKELSCNHNNLTNLEHGPSIVTERYDVAHNQLTSLKGAPTTTKYFNCAKNNLKDLVGGPKKITDEYFCGFNPLTSLEGAPEEVTGRFSCYGAGLTSLKGVYKHLKHVDGNASFGNNPIKSHVLGLLKIKSLKRVELSTGHDFDDATELTEVETIINRHLAGERDVLACQDELIDAGLDEYAQL